MICSWYSSWLSSKYVVTHDTALSYFLWQSATIISWARRDESLWRGFTITVQLVLLSGLVVTGNWLCFQQRHLSAFDVISNGNKDSCLWHRRNFMIRPKLRHQSSIGHYSTDNRSKLTRFLTTTGWYEHWQTCLAWRKAGGSLGLSEPMLAQCDVPGINMASSVALWFVSTLNACQGSMDPVMVNAKSQC